MGRRKGTAAGVTLAGIAVAAALLGPQAAGLAERELAAVRWQQRPAGTVTGKGFAFDYETNDPWDGSYYLTVTSDDAYPVTTGLERDAHETARVTVTHDVWEATGIGQRWGD